MRYRRARAAGGTYFFKVNLAEQGSDLLVRQVEDVRSVMSNVKLAHQFSIVAMVLLPEHLHAIWRLPAGDADYAMRWSLVKAGFSRRGKRRTHSQSREAKRERGLWQRRHWEHPIRDEAHLAQHVDYSHFNPMKHGWVSHPADWPHSTLHGYIERGMVPRDWGGHMSVYLRRFFSSRGDVTH